MYRAEVGREAGATGIHEINEKILSYEKVLEKNLGLEVLFLMSG